MASGPSGPPPPQIDWSNLISSFTGLLNNIFGMIGQTIKNKADLKVMEAQLFQQECQKRAQEAKMDAENEVLSKGQEFAEQKAETEMATELAKAIDPLGFDETRDSYDYD